MAVHFPSTCFFVSGELSWYRDGAREEKEEEEEGFDVKDDE